MSEEFDPEERFGISQAIENLDSEKEFNLNQLAPGRIVELETNRTHYKIEIKDDGFYISGHPTHCPEPIKVDIASFEDGFGPESIKPSIIREGWRLMYQPTGKNPIHSGHIQKFKLL